MNRNWDFVFDLLVMFLVGSSIRQVVCCGRPRDLDVACAPFDLGVVFLEPWQSKDNVLGPEIGD